VLGSESRQPPQNLTGFNVLKTLCGGKDTSVFYRSDEPSQGDKLMSPEYDPEYGGWTEDYHHPGPPYVPPTGVRRIFQVLLLALLLIIFVTLASVIIAIPVYWILSALLPKEFTLFSLNHLDTLGRLSYGLSLLFSLIGGVAIFISEKDNPF
jgi:phage shock protein PspC (stress-responsive transcriptional regulator)